MTLIVNLAAHPDEPDIRREFYRLAALCLEPEGYLIKEGKSLAHLTVIQGEVASEEEGLRLTQDLLNKPVDVTLTGLHLKLQHPFVWVELPAVRSPPLMLTHTEAVDRFKRAGLRVFNKSGDEFAPHATLARRRLDAQPLPVDALLRSPLFGRPMRCTFRLGLSDQNWQFVQFIDGLKL